MKITWFGHSAFLLEGKRKVLIDPFLSENPVSPVKPSDVDADLILVTHGHGDHLGDSVEISKRRNCPIIAIYELSKILTDKGVETIGMNIGGTAEVMDVRITMVKAFHSADIVEDGVISAGNPVGFVVDLDGVRVYHCGDTDVFMDMKLIGELYNPDVMLVPIGGWYTMGINEAVKAVELVRPKYAIPMHYNTFPVIRADPEEFKKKVEEKTETKVIILKPGESFEV